MWINHTYYLRSYEISFGPGSLQRDYEAIMDISIQKAFRKEPVVPAKNLARIVGSSTFEHIWMDHLGVMLGPALLTHMWIQRGWQNNTQPINKMIALRAKRDFWKVILSGMTLWNNKRRLSYDDVCKSMDARAFRGGSGGPLRVLPPRLNAWYNWRHGRRTPADERLLFKTSSSHYVLVNHV